MRDTIKWKWRPKAPPGSRCDRLYALLRRRRNTPKPIRAEPRRAREAGSGVVMSVDCVNNVSEHATAFVAGPAGCEHDSDNVATAVGPVMNGLGPTVVSAVRVP